MKKIKILFANILIILPHEEFILSILSVQQWQRE